MKNYLLIALIIILSIYVIVILIPDKDGQLNVLVVYTGIQTERAEAIKNGIASIMEEEGVPHKFIYSHNLLQQDPKKILKYHPAIIFADEITKDISLDVNPWINDIAE